GCGRGWRDRKRRGGAAHSKTLRASTSKGRDERPVALFDPSRVPPQLTSVLRDGLDDTAHDLVRSHAVALGGEVRAQTMAHHGGSNGRDVSAAHTSLTAEQGTCACGDHKTEAGARAGAPAQPFATEIKGRWILRPGHANEPFGVLINVIADRDAADGCLQIDDLIRGQHGFG